ncbi:MAG: hypothetical protein ACYC6W_02735 [Nitrosotalea sp.]
MFGLQNNSSVYSSINVTKLISIVENNTEFKEQTNGHGYVFSSAVYKLKPYETVNNSTFQGPVDIVYFLSIDNKGGYYDKTLVVTVNSKLSITGFMVYPSYLVPTGYPLPAGTSLPHQGNYTPPKMDYNKLVIIMPSSPLEQVKSGIAVNDVECFHGIPTLELIFKAEDKSPVCVKSNTVSDLIKRGWALNQTNNESIDVTAEQPIIVHDINGTIAATLTLDISLKNFELLSPPLLVQVHYPNGTLYHTDTISMNSIPADGHYKYVLVMYSYNPHDIFGKHSIEVIHAGNISQILVDIATS